MLNFTWLFRDCKQMLLFNLMVKFLDWFKDWFNVLSLEFMIVVDALILFIVFLIIYKLGNIESILQRWDIFESFFKSVLASTSSQPDMIFPHDLFFLHFSCKFLSFDILLNSFKISFWSNKWVLKQTTLFTWIWNYWRKSTFTNLLVFLLSF